MYHTISEFIAEWTYESESTLKLLSILTDASLEQKVYPEGRSLGRLAWHIVQSLGEMGSQAGLKFSASVEKAPLPDAGGKIVSTYRSVAVALGNAIKASWTDAGLSEEIEMYGEKWTRSKVLSSLIKHEIHHRAQMTVLMRQAGLKVPGIYGPSKEEWVQFNMTSPE